MDTRSSHAIYIALKYRVRIARATCVATCSSCSTDSPSQMGISFMRAYHEAQAGLLFCSHVAVDLLWTSTMVLVGTWNRVCPSSLAHRAVQTTQSMWISWIRVSSSCPAQACTATSWTLQWVLLYVPTSKVHVDLTCMLARQYIRASQLIRAARPSRWGSNNTVLSVVS